MNVFRYYPYLMVPTFKVSPIEVGRTLQFIEDIFDTCWELRIAKPIILNFAQALGADRRGAEILPKVLARRLSALDQLVDRLADRPL